VRLEMVARWCGPSAAALVRPEGAVTSWRGSAGLVIHCLPALSLHPLRDPSGNKPVDSGEPAQAGGPDPFPSPAARRRRLHTPPTLSAAAMCAPAAGPFYRAAGMSYLKYANICADLLRAVMKEPHKGKAAARSSIYFRAASWAEGKQGKPGGRRGRGRSCGPRRPGTAVGPGAARRGGQRGRSLAGPLAAAPGAEPRAAARRSDH
jgi:F-type H+-transporting ATPase subunit epsilon